ncbi:MAG: hypothetical protein E7408_04475 [Ruminococcaceae bacterium]|nr:hypothetical protein [Oscillospiraceae bacterium]
MQHNGRTTGERNKKVNLLYYMVLSFALLGILAVLLPSLAVSLAAANLILIAVRFLLWDVKPDQRCKKFILWGVLFGNVFLAVYTYFQNFIPFWDYAGYYKETLRCGTLLAEDIPAFFTEMYQSMLESDYTLLPTLFLAPLHRLLGGTFTLYIFLIYNIFLVPFFVLFSLLINEVNPKCLPLVFLFTPFLSPALRGYLDGAGLIYVGIWLYLIYKGTFRRSAIWEDIVLGLLSVVLVFTRRWYLFFLVGTMAALVLSGAFFRLFNKKVPLWPVVKNLLICGGTTLGVVTVFFFPYLMRLFTNNMADAYSAYMFGDFWWNIKYFIRYYGFLPTVFYALGLLGLRRKKYRQLTLFLLFQIPIMFFLFTRIQTVSYHHQYLFAPEIFLLGAIGIASLPKWNRTALIAYTTVLSVAFAYIYVPVPGDSLRNVFSSVRFAPKTMETEGVQKLRDRLNALTDAEGGYVYVLASSETLNDDMLKNSMLPEKDNAMHTMLGTNHVDKRDGIPNHLFVCKYVVVAEPVQVHLGADNQQVVDFFAREILDGTYTPNLERIESISVADGVIAHIYRRNNGYTEEFLNRVQAHFNTLYPEHTALFEVDFIWSQN